MEKGNETLLESMLLVFGNAWVATGLSMERP